MNKLLENFLKQQAGQQQDLNTIMRGVEKETGMTLLIKHEDECNATIEFCGEIMAPDGQTKLAYLGEVTIKVKETTK